MEDDLWPPLVIKSSWLHVHAHTADVLNEEGAVFASALFQIGPRIKSEYDLHIIQTVGIPSCIGGDVSSVHFRFHSG